MFAPTYQISHKITRDLMTIEGARQSMINLPIDVEMLRSLRESAKLLTTHFSTQIEGNRLTQAEVAEVVSGARFPGRERDTNEVRNYYAALEEVERLGKTDKPLSESTIQRIHGVAYHGRLKETPYRDGQNVIRDNQSGVIAYLPPEASDVSALMGQLVTWVEAELTAGDLSVPVLAGLLHYQLATIHPYYDGNGRMARLVTTLLLHRCGYGLKGIYSLEEHYAKNLGAYYRALSVGPSHNYYEGRAGADVTGFLEYFCDGMAKAFLAIRIQASRAAEREDRDQEATLRELDPRKRQVLSLLHAHSPVTAAQLAAHLGLSPRTVRDLCATWVNEGFLECHDSSRKKRSYRLPAE
ncbi:MAG: Fic family protein [Planctomycetota bacterium]|jgi:Fic family protein